VTASVLADEELRRVQMTLEALRISVPTLHASAKHLIGLGILRLLPTSGRQRLFVYERYLEI